MADSEQPGDPEEDSARARGTLNLAAHSRESGAGQAGIRLAHAALSDQGNVRPENEDALGHGTALIGGEWHHLFAVADGLGGHQGGAQASRAAVGTVVAGLAEAGAAVPEGAMRVAFRRANLAVFDGAQATQQANMQTTLTALALSRTAAIVGHVGDSRAYRLRGGRLELLTTDHTQVHEMLRLRLLTPEQAAKHPGRSVLTRSLGAELLVRVDVRREAVATGDIYLLCTDGLWGEVSAEEIRQRLRKANLERACEELVQLAKARGGPDNMSLIAVRVEAVDPGPRAPAGWRSLFTWR